MSLTHEEAHRLIQLHLDRALTLEESAALSAHLHSCRDCQAYASEMNEVERLLTPVMKKQWNLQPIPLSIPSLLENTIQPQPRTLLAMRTAAIGLVFLALFFSAWQFVISGPSVSNQIHLSAPPVPTPLSLTAQSTRTEISLENCEITSYTVQEGDTLAGLAERFAVRQDEIMALNNLGTASIDGTNELLIPICNSTPTGTAQPASFTDTYTPVLKINTSTPDS